MKNESRFTALHRVNVLDGDENPFVDPSCPEEEAVGLLSKLVSNGDEGVGAGGTGVRLLLEVTGLTSLFALAFDTGTSSEISMFS